MNQSYLDPQDKSTVMSASTIVASKQGDLKLTSPLCTGSGAGLVFEPDAGLVFEPQFT
jgi:hypothetical protein